MEDVSYVQKENKKVNNQYSFVSHDAVVAKIRPALIKHRVLFTSWIKEVKVNENRVELTLGYRFINVDNPEETLEGSSFGFGIDNQDKGPGKATSYAKKYALLQAFLLETGDDPERDMIDYTPPAKVSQGENKLGDLVFYPDGQAKAITYLRSIKWIEEEGGIESLTPDQRKQIEDNWEGFCSNAGII